MRQMFGRIYMAVEKIIKKKSIYQLKKLIRSIRSVFNDENYPILIDEEGGKVSRLSNIVDFSVFSQEYFGKTFTSNKKNFTFGGRLADYAYYDMDMTISAALKKFEKIKREI